ncbi:cytochrome P460 family protein [Aquimarina sp. 2201CG5-10]|uniref:cytochrome P460 family protein n=1 Tax=Aquimarina callyspongiae TaxID=3098150 RepID=UPI002AB43B9F|nr:cytochrome P460 family protein [Aquimarina sp. 2201CG5-10]MDY8134535.1 cytochrome P460 family protein [Aquimarina sp. 2201CG5-10]
MKKRIILPGILVLSIVILSFNKRMDNATDRYVPITNKDKVEIALIDFQLDYSDYKNWYRITKDKPNTGDPTGFLSGKHKGIKAYREVYVNKIGEAVNKGSAPYKYPAGTMIVKEEYKNEAAWKSGKKPSIKLMVKLKEGESPETGDWGYASKLNAKKIATRTSGKAKFCTKCHIFVAAKDDYVFMNSDFLKSESNRN